MNFRKDINGLRAIAVIAVVLYHFNSSLIPGGFAGVDVFFVISGYLMTGIIFKGIGDESFSLTNFYLARANRIIPPLAILCFTLLILGYFFLTINDYRSLGREIVTSITFTSNILFSMKKGYFDVDDSFLLHTWSLAAEWQFYIIYPAVLMLLNNLVKMKVIKKLILIGALIGFVFCIYATLYWPNQSFFLLPMRAWEMMLGGVAFLYPHAFKRLNQSVMEYLGIFLIVISYFLMSESYLWPGYLALVPVLGTYLVISANKEHSFISNNRVIQVIGKCSYSLYLWHWPIAVTFVYYGIDGKYQGLGIALSFILGWYSYKIVECKNFFKKQNFQKNIIVHTGIIFFLSLLGGFIYSTDGLARRIDLQSNSLIHGSMGNDYTITEGVTLLNTDKNYDYLLIGDSNAAHYTRGILDSTDKVKISWYGTCVSLPNMINKREGYYINWKNDCKNNYKLGTKETKIIIAQSWVHEDGFFECTKVKCDADRSYHSILESELAIMFDLYQSNADIYIVGELPKSTNNKIMICLRFNALINLNLECGNHEEPRENVWAINELLSRISNKFDNVHFINPTGAVCTDNICSFSKDGKSIFMSDGSHLSGFGSEVMWDYIRNRIDVKESDFENSPP